MDKQNQQSNSQKLAATVLNVYHGIGASSDAVFITDTKGRITFVNPAFLKLNGWAESEALGKSVSEIPQSKNVSVKLLQALSHGTSWEARHQIHQKHASPEGQSQLLWVKTCLNPIHAVPGEVSGFVGTQRDITREITMELRLKKEMGEVMALAIRRAKELKQSQADQAQAELEAVSRSNFLASMSHEIRTPLNGVLGMTELLLNTQLSNKQQHLADIIHRSGTNLLDLINDILDLSKIEAGKMELNNDVHDLRLLLEDVADTFSERANSKGLELTCVFPSNQHALFHCDRQRLTQILTNLTGNAIKFTTKGEVTIQASLVEEENDDQLLRFDVIDTGPGIPEEKCGEIFESFSQIQSSQDQHTKGTGLGLAICKELAEMMGGEIGVESEFGKGSRFWFTAKLRKEIVEENTDQLNAEIDALKGIKILVVDDNLTSRSALIEQLKTWHVDVHGADSGIEAMNLLKQAANADEPFKLTLVDQDMPDVSGLNLARMLKENPVFANTPLVLLHSVNDLEETLVWTTAGVKAYLTKPVRFEELFNCLTATLSIPVHKTEKQANLEQSRNTQNYQSRILVAEDNHVNQELITMMLEEFGCEVTIAENGQIAIDKLNQGDEYDLIFMDCLMPELDGLSATKQIRTLNNDQLMVDAQHLPIIALTANAMPDDQKKCLAAGMNDYMTKPFSRQKLAEALDKWLAEKRKTVKVSSERPASTPPISEPESVFETTQPITPLSQDSDKEPQKHQAEPEKTQPSVAQVQSNELTQETALGEETCTPKLNAKTLDNIRSLQREGAPDILKKIVGLYLDNSNGLIGEIEEAVKEQDAKRVRSTAHSLKSSSANLGADVLAAACKDLELMGKNNSLEGSEEKYQELKAEYDAACDALKAEISEGAVA